MNEMFIEIINNYGYIGILMLILIENIFPPIPSEIVLLFGGFMTTTTNMNIPLVIISATVGSVVGAIVLYGLGKVLKKDRLKQLFASRFGKVLRLKPEMVDMADKWFVKYEKKAVLICRCIPIVRSIISIPAGISEMNMGIFLVLTTIGSLIWNTIIVSLGAFLGDNWEVGLQYLETYKGIFIIVVVVICITVGIPYIIRLRKQKKELSQ